MTCNNKVVVAIIFDILKAPGFYNLEATVLYWTEKEIIVLRKRF